MSQNSPGPRPSRVTADVVVCTPGEEHAARNTFLDVVDGRIAADVHAEPDVLLDAPGTAAIPSLGNGHDHGRPVSPLAFGAVDGPLESWLTAVRQMPRFDPEAAATVFFGRLLASGFTATMHLDRPGEPQTLVESLTMVGRTAATMGMAAAIAVPMANRRNLLYADDDATTEALRGCGYAGDPSQFLPNSIASVEEQMATVDAIADEVEDGRVSVQYGPQGPQWVSDDLLEAVADASLRSGRRVHMHVFETFRQRVWADDEYPAGLIPHLDALGLLSERLSIAHGVWLRPDELELLAERGVSIVVNSTSNLRLRSGTAPMAAMLAAGVGVATGLDGLGFDDDVDGFRETRLAHLLQAGTGLEDVVSARDCFRAAMDQAHRVVRGVAGPWGFAEGAPADIALLDRDRLRADLVVDVSDDELIRARATASHVKHVISGGHVVVRDGRVLTADVDEADKLINEQMMASADELSRQAIDVAALQQAQRRYYGKAAPAEGLEQ
ncbi:MAG: cytosine/adenosine deaminase-related metal-dependent hydrolase [Ilumatobacter sp.]|jgi:cytosine/adenosine deaminase-related metal-dependent hydrolase